MGIGPHSSSMQSLQRSSAEALYKITLIVTRQHCRRVTIMLRRLEISYGLDGVVLQWFVSYLDHRKNLPSLFAVEVTLRPP